MTNGLCYNHSWLHLDTVVYNVVSVMLLCNLRFKHTKTNPPTCLPSLPHSSLVTFVLSLKLVYSGFVASYEFLMPEYRKTCTGLMDYLEQLSRIVPAFSDPHY